MDYDNNNIRYEMTIYKNWTADVNRIVEKNLEKPLLVRNEETLLLTMNFDPEVGLYYS